MPREQRVQLNKSGVVETPLGEIKSGVTGTVNFEREVQAKSLGQSLAEGLNMATKAVTTFAEAKNKEIREMEGIKQEGLGKKSAGEFTTQVVKDVADMPLTVINEEDGTTSHPRRKAMMDKLNEFNQGMQANDSIHPAYYQAAMSKAGRILEGYATGWDNDIINNTLAERQRELGGTLRDNIFSEGMSTHEALAKSMKSHRFDTREENTTFVLSLIAADIEEKIQSDKDGTYDSAADIAKYLKIKSADKVEDFAKDPKYKEIIDKLEAQQVAHSSSLIKKQTEYSKKLAESATAAAMDMVLKPGATPEDRVRAEGILEGASKHMSGKARGSMVKLMRDLEQTGYASTSDPTVLFKAKQLATEGNMTFNEILKLKTNLTADDVKEVYQATIDRNKALETREGARFYSNMEKLTSSAKGILNVMSGVDKFMDPVGGANRVQHFQDNFIMAVEDYKETNGTEVVPYKELLQIRNDAQKGAFDTFPTKSLNLDAAVPNAPTTGDKKEEDTGGILNWLFGDDKPTETTTEKPKDSNEETAANPSYEEFKAGVSKDVTLNILKSTDADAALRAMAERLKTEMGW
jgi:hypothetical protein